MKNSQGLWRGLFFIILITALCGGLALPAVSGPVRAAPQLQTAVDVVISEFRTRGPNGAFDEFVELYNPTSASVDISGWKINASGSTGSTGTRATIPSSTILLSGQYYLVANNNTSGGYSGGVSANLNYGSGIADNGGVALIRTDNSIADQVGMSAGSAYKEGITLSPLSGTSNQSYERKLGGASDSCEDTDNNSIDFSNIAPSNPQNLSSPVSLCGTILPTSTSTSTPTSTSTATSTATATATNTSIASTAGVVISEFRTRGTNGANDEFIEIYNPTTNAVEISGWRINASNDTGTTSTRATIPASTLLRSGQYYLVANTSTGGYSGTVSANLTYGTGITDAGGVALVKADNTIVDQVGLGATSAYKEGATLAPLTGTANQSYERKLGGASDSCQDTNDNSADFQLINPSSPHNYSSPLSRCGVPGPASLITTTTTITSDSPDPSVVNGGVLVSVTVAVPGSSPIATGKVNITGANANCSITLNSTGKGSCTVIFTSSGSKGLAATYLGDNTHSGSADSESHQVTTVTAIKTPTHVPTPLPPPPLVGINEFVPRPGHDWNNDGVINVGDEYIELLNHGVIDVNLSGYSLDDEVNIGSTPYRLPAITLKPGERHVFYGSETGLLLSDGGDGVRLLKPNGQLVDAYNYSVVRFPDQSYCRLPDNGGLDDWNQNCFPTPGLQNSLSGRSASPPTENGTENLCPIADTLPNAFLLAECLPFGNNIWNPDYWDKFGWFDERNLPESLGKWPVFAD